MNLINQEYKAVLGLLQRSYNLNNGQIRNFHSTLVNFSEEKKDGNSNDQNQNNKDDKKKKNENDEKVMSVLTKAILWMMTLYMFIVVISFILPKKNNPETSTRYVAWNEFVHQMLSKGEVKELIIRPDMDVVTIILHEGAIFKGRRTSSGVYHIAVADTVKFEEKLRDVESLLGIKEGVPVTYERSNDFGNKLFITLILLAIILSFASRMGGMKAPLSMDSFVRSVTRLIFNQNLIEIPFVFIFRVKWDVQNSL